ncbi:hypothetical protein SAMN04488693_10783 [Arthrobacter subterraneus]|uniref:Uncharacterized protein n=2 Tax=Arthrobacter subterraneus TaxID=335973 RepID=A0A1G8IND6_9MICC|nr:hypothetical protein SAMN04488693_10783 [Arthrobacter subterraneus]
MELPTGGHEICPLPQLFLPRVKRCGASPRGLMTVSNRINPDAGVVTVGVLTGKLTRSELEAHPHHHILDSVADVPALLDKL